MINEFDMSRIDIPYGVLHDQCLSNVNCKNNNMIFSFDIEIYPQNYSSGFYKQYETFKHCEMSVNMCDESGNEFILDTLNLHGKIRGLSLSREEFLEAINSGIKATFVECYVTHNAITIELWVDFYNAKGKCKKYKKFNNCYISLYATKIKWTWY